MAETIQIGTLSARKGEKICGRLPITSRADGSEIYVPLMVVNGREEGPVLNVSAGCHGDEYEGMEAIRRIYRGLDPAALRGTFLGVPVLNIMAFDAAQRCTPYDGLNLNRCFPGKERGFVTERLAYIYYNEVIKKADYVIDLHNGGTIMTLAPMAIYRDIGGSEVAARAEKLVGATGVELIWKGSGGWTGPISLEAQKIGIPAITVEIAGEGRVREAVIGQFEKVIRNTLAGFGMIEGKPDLPEKVRHFEGTFINSIKGGYYLQKVELNEMVRKGDLVGTICDYFGDVAEEIRAPFDGVVCSRRTMATIEPGGWTLMVGRLL